MTTSDISNPIPRCSVFLAASLDGFIAGPNGEIDWLDSMDTPDEDYGFYAFFESIDALVIGRNTYDVASGFGEWPYANKTCVVLTHHPTESRHGEEFVEATPAQVVEQLRARGVRRAYIDGGKVIRQFLAAGLVDDITLSVVPILLGDGIPLFDRGARQTLTLVDCRSWPTGLVQLRYRVE